MTTLMVNKTKTAEWNTCPTPLSSVFTNYLLTHLIKKDVSATNKAI